MTDVAIQKALQQFASRDFRGWRGLAPGTSLADVAEVSDTDTGWRARGLLGESDGSAEWANATFARYEYGVRVWLEPESDRVLLMDTESPVLATEIQALVQDLGGPEAKLDSYLRTLRLRESEWVFASRGLTLYLNPETEILLRLAVYTGGTLESYRRELRLNLKETRLPLGEMEEER